MRSRYSGRSLPSTGGDLDKGHARGGGARGDVAVAERLHPSVHVLAGLGHEVHRMERVRIGVVEPVVGRGDGVDRGSASSGCCAGSSMRSPSMKQRRPSTSDAAVLVPGHHGHRGSSPGRSDPQWLVTTSIAESSRRRPPQASGGASRCARQSVLRAPGGALRRRGYPSLEHAGCSRSAGRAEPP